jgi:hypothetical protein
MPRLVADQNLWRTSAAKVCVGQGEHPRRFEWELRSGALWALIDTPVSQCYQTFPQKNRTREAGLALVAACSFVRKVEKQSPAGACGCLHNLGTKQNFWSIRPRLKSTKNWSPDSHRAAVFRFEWKASGFTELCFWTAPPRLIVELERSGEVRLAPNSARPD